MNSKAGGKQGEEELKKIGRREEGRQGHRKKKLEGGIEGRNYERRKERGERSRKDGMKKTWKEG